MQIVYDIPRLKRILTDLSVLTDVRMGFCDSDGKQLLNTSPRDDYCSKLQKDKSVLKKCRRSDADLLNRCKKSGKLEKHVCFAGLCDLAMPIVKQGTVAGYVIMGRICTPETKQIPDMPKFSDEKLESFTDLLPNILFESAIQLRQDTLSEQATGYILNNLDKDLSVTCICNHLHTSKNVLYTLFHNTYGCTINEFVSKSRLDKAKTLLATTNDTVFEISQAVGINNYTYFCKLFKKNEGISPLEYRKNFIDK